MRSRRWPRPLTKDYRPPVLRDSDGRWIGGDLRRDSTYDDQGR